MTLTSGKQQKVYSPNDRVPFGGFGVRSVRRRLQGLRMLPADAHRHAHSHANGWDAWHQKPTANEPATNQRTVRPSWSSLCLEGRHRHPPVTGVRIYRMCSVSSNACLTCRSILLVLVGQCISGFLMDSCVKDTRGPLRWQPFPKPKEPLLSENSCRRGNQFQQSHAIATQRFSEAILQGIDV